MSFVKEGIDMIHATESVQATATATENTVSLEDVIQGVLQRTGQYYLRGIDIVVQPDSVVLQGFVPTYYMKQVAQEAVLTVADGHRIDNQIEVI